MHQRHLAEATRHVARGLELVAQQQDRVLRLERDGHDASQARDLLAVLEETPRLMQAHHELILRSLGRL
jgi:hypothetical protein